MTVRRICAIRLDAQTPDPTERLEFKHELPRWAIEARGDLVWAALTIIQHWVASGRPDGTARVASFERWSAVMGGILATADIPDFGTAASTFRQARNVRGNAWLALVERWWSEFRSDPVGSAELWLVVEGIGVEGDLGVHGARIREPRIAFGKALRQQRGRQFRFGITGGSKIEVRLEADGPTTRRPFRLYLVTDEGLKVVPSEDEVPFSM